MSLINQALRKAQRDRSPNRMAQPGEPNPAGYAHSTGNGMRPGIMIGLIVAIALLIGLVAGLSIVIFSGGDSAVAGTTAPSPEVPSVSPVSPVASTAASPSPVVDPQMMPPAASTADQSSQPIAPSESSVVAELRKAREAAEAKAAEEARVAEVEAARAKQAAAEAAEAAVRAAAQPNEEIIEWLSRSRVTGVRLSDNDSRVLLNGETYAVGETINSELGLKVMIIEETRILFMDSNGKKYMKRL